jgi:hypothetical protein
MSLLSIEVDFHHGRVLPRGDEQWPEQGRGILTVLSTTEAPLQPKMSVSEFLAKWKGDFSEPAQEQRDADPRIDYLMRKYAK